MFTSIIAILLVFGLIVAVHEWGHMIAAKLCGVAVPNFALGMGPSLVSRMWRGTRYHLCAFPIGGFVTIAGMEGDDPLNAPRRREPAREAADALEDRQIEQLHAHESPALALQLGLPALASDEQIDAAEAVETAEPGEIIDVDSLEPYQEPAERVAAAKAPRLAVAEPPAIAHRPEALADPRLGKTWRDISGFQKAFILVAGPLMNFVLALIVIFAMGLLGFPQNAVIMTTVRPGAPADLAGLRAGDMITAVGERRVSNARQFQAIVQASKDISTPITYERGGETLSTRVTPQVIPGFNNNEVSLGVGLDEVYFSSTVVNLVSPGSFADKAGLRIGDKVLQFQGKDIYNGMDMLVAMPFFDEQGRAIDSDGKLIPAEGPVQKLLIERQARHKGQSPTAGIKPEGVGSPRIVAQEGTLARIEYSLPSDTSMLSLGLAFKPSLQRLPFGQSVVRSLQEARDVAIGTLFSLRMMFTHVGLQSISGPVGISRMIAQSAHSGFYELLQILMIINLSLGMLNLMPIPALDGGRLVFVALNGLGLKINAQREMLVHTVSMILLLGLIALITLKDVLALLHL